MSDEIKTVFVDHGPPQGISLRDYFAGQALPWCLREYGDEKRGHSYQPIDAFETAYQIADWMLLESEKGGDQ